MAKRIADPFSLTADEIHALISGGKSLFPELDAARKDPKALLSLPATKAMLADSEAAMKDIAHIPQTTYTPASLFVLTGDREQYEEPYFAKRAKLAAAAVRLFLGQTGLRDIVQDYIWNICEETTWVLPAHLGRPIDLFSAETAYNLAETLYLLGDTLDVEIRARVLREVEARIFQPYLQWHRFMHWYTTPMNWNGVCNSSVAATFLLLDPERRRAAKAVEIALAGLRVFVDTAFEEDGTSTEGVGYWEYGLLNFIPLAEMLRSASGGAIDLLHTKRMRLIAAYPSKILLSPGHFMSFSDSHEESTFNPGNVARLAERTGDLALPALLSMSERGEWRLNMLLRNMLWWDGSKPRDIPIDDAFLPAGATARLVARTPSGVPVTVAVKAGHNDVPHNNNDIGTFMVHVDGESLLTDPGAGLYTRQYFSDERYQNVFCNSYGHSVPRVGGQLQPEGRQYGGKIRMDAGGAAKKVTVDFTHAYAVKNMKSARRQITLASEGNDAGTVLLQDDFSFSGKPVDVEEAFITWDEAEVKGAIALIHGKRHALKLTIEAPAGAQFSLERLEKESKENAKPQVLKRLAFVMPAAATQQARLRMEVVANKAS